MALRVYARHAVDGETISLADGQLTVTHESAGAREQMEFGCAHVRIAPPVDAHSLIEVVAHGRRVDVGRHVRPEWRPVVAGERRRALQAAGHGPLR